MDHMSEGGYYLSATSISLVTKKLGLITKSIEE